ncbi:MAG: hypothetical protein KBA31_04295 [Alphaproteobacteria bacterium]|nr:hypothetical protein [Alphaproteobacteria bacterium]
MRDTRNILAVLPLVFAGFHAGSSVICLIYYTLLYLVSAEHGETVASFFAHNGFIGAYLGGVSVSLLITLAFAIFLWFVNAKSASDRSRVERLIDNWVTSLARKD